MIPVTYIIMTVEHDGALSSALHLWHRHVIPFAPTIGMELCPVIGDRFRKVRDVRWSALYDLEVWLEPEPDINISMLTGTYGWKRKH